MFLSWAPPQLKIACHSRFDIHIYGKIVPNHLISVSCEIRAVLCAFVFFLFKKPASHVRDFKHNHVLYRHFSIIHVFTCPNLLALPLITKGLTLAQGTKSLAFKLPCSTRLASLKKMF